MLLRVQPYIANHTAKNNERPLDIGQLGSDDNVIDLSFKTTTQTGETAQFYLK